MINWKYANTRDLLANLLSDTSELNILVKFIYFALEMLFSTILYKLVNTTLELSIILDNNASHNVCTQW